MSLRSFLQETEALIAPGIYDSLGAVLVQNAGFRAAYLSGASLALSWDSMDSISDAVVSCCFCIVGAVVGTLWRSCSSSSLASSSIKELSSPALLPAEASAVVLSLLLNLIDV